MVTKIYLFLCWFDSTLSGIKGGIPDNEHITSIIVYTHILHILCHYTTLSDQSTEGNNDNIKNNNTILKKYPKITNQNTHIVLID